MNGKWNNEFGEVNLIKEIKLRRWLKASFYDSKTDFTFIEFKKVLVNWSLPKV
jgi:hypothetical protein